MLIPSAVDPGQAERTRGGRVDGRRDEQASEGLRRCAQSGNPAVTLTVRQLLDYLGDLPDDTPVVIDVRPGDEYVRAEDIIITDEDVARKRTPIGVQLMTRKVQRDAIQQELIDLRAALCYTLGKYHSKPGPQGITIISVLSDQEISMRSEDSA